MDHALFRIVSNAFLSICRILSRLTGDFRPEALESLPNSSKVKIPPPSQPVRLITTAYLLWSTVIFTAAHSSSSKKLNVPTVACVRSNRDCALDSRISASSSFFGQFAISVPNVKLSFPNSPLILLIVNLPALRLRRIFGSVNCTSSPTVVTSQISSTFLALVVKSKVCTGRNNVDNNGSPIKPKSNVSSSLMHSSLGVKPSVEESNVLTSIKHFLLKLGCRRSSASDMRARSPSVVKPIR